MKLFNISLIFVSVVTFGVVLLYPKGDKPQVLFLNQNGSQKNLPEGILSSSLLSSSSEQRVEKYWFLLERRSNIEKLYKGEPGRVKKSTLIKQFNVKSGILGERPTPLPEKLGRKYWLITKKEETPDNPETAPYFLTLDIPVSDTEPFGPTPYLECNGQCDWVLPGAFGLHGVAGDETKLASESPGSSGCIRHRNEDITYLYKLLKDEKEEIRYYIQDT